jgi:hypothetical protein
MRVRSRRLLHGNEDPRSLDGAFGAALPPEVLAPRFEDGSDDRKPRFTVAGQQQGPVEIHIFGALRQVIAGAMASDVATMQPIIRPRASADSARASVRPPVLSSLTLIRP